MAWKEWYPAWLHDVGDIVIQQATVDYGPPPPANDIFPLDLTRNLAYRVLDMPGKGKGMVAKRKLSRGDLFLSEAPLFLFNAEVKPVGLVSFYKELPIKAKTTLLELANSSSPSLSSDTPLEEQLKRLVEICHTNGFDISSYSSEEIVGMFPIGSRINHSCTPNATRHVVMTSGGGLQFEFRAVRDIGVAEEITITYIHMFQPWRERHQLLFQNWRFRCGCEACSLRGLRLAESDRRRSELGRIWSAAWEPDKAVETMERAIWLLDEERLLSGRSAFYSRLMTALRESGNRVALEEWTPRAEEAYFAERGLRTVE